MRDWAKRSVTDEKSESPLSQNKHMRLKDNLYIVTAVTMQKLLQNSITFHSTYLHDPRQCPRTNFAFTRSPWNAPHYSHPPHCKSGMPSNVYRRRMRKKEQRWRKNGREAETV